MVTCPSCGSEVYGNSKYCHQCVWELAVPAKPELSYVEIPEGAVITCPKCGAKNFRTDSVCRECETDLKAAKLRAAGRPEEEKAARKAPPKSVETCARCGTISPLGYRFCTSCGGPLAPGRTSADPPEDEVGAMAKILFKVVSFLIPVAGFVIGAVFYVRYPDPRGGVSKDRQGLHRPRNHQHHNQLHSRDRAHDRGLLQRSVIGMSESG